MDNSDHIATLLATHVGLCTRALALPFNESRYSPRSVVTRPQASRDSTPDGGNSHSTDGGVEQYHRIDLSFDRPPKQNGEFVFGRDVSCDVLLASEKDMSPDDWEASREVSRRHFSIGFDDHSRLVIRDFSRKGLWVSYDDKDGDGKYETRRHFRWIVLNWLCRKIEIGIPNTGLRFMIVAPEFKADSPVYTSRIQQLRGSRSVLDTGLNTTLQLLNVHSNATTAVPSGVMSPRLQQRPIYLKSKALGCGSFGRVDQVVDVSTGAYYARKTFFREYGDGESVAKEITALKELSHDHIVRFVSSCMQPRPELVMEYAQYGSLEGQHRESPITRDDCISILRQVLQALEYMHSRAAAHRDIKPANILVTSRSPLHVKLGDFGLAKFEVAHRSSGFETHCGTPYYCAPEVGQERYTVAVDIWSLGVVALELLHGLPNPKLVCKSTSWHDAVALFASCSPHDDLFQFLSINMIKTDPFKRQSAKNCLIAMQHLRIGAGLRHSHTVESSRSSNTTPSAAPAQPSFVPLTIKQAHSKGASTIRGNPQRTKRPSSKALSGLTSTQDRRPSSISKRPDRATQMRVHKSDLRQPRRSIEQRRSTGRERQDRGVGPKRGLGRAGQVPSPDRSNDPDKISSHVMGESKTVPSPSKDEELSNRTEQADSLPSYHQPSTRGEASSKSEDSGDESSLPETFPSAYASLRNITGCEY